MLEKEKILTVLKDGVKQYGLSVEILDSLASTVQVEDESALNAWIESQKPVFAAMQKSLDTARAQRGQQKPKDDDQQGDKLERLIEAKFAAIGAQYEQQIVELKNKLSESENRANQDIFNDKVKRIGKELGLNDEVLTLLSGNLKSDMSDDDIKNSLSQSKATLIKAGLPVEDSAQRKATNAEQLRQDAKDWVTQQIEKQKSN